MGLVALGGLCDPIARTVQLCRSQRLSHRYLYRVELVVTCHLFGDAAAVVLKHYASDMTG